MNEFAANRVKFMISPFVKLPLFNAAVSFCFGVLLGNVIVVENEKMCFLVILVVLTLVAVNNSKKYIFPLMLCVLFILLGVLRVRVFEHNETLPSSISTYNGFWVELSGTISREVGVEDSSIVLTPKLLKMCKSPEEQSKCLVLGSPHGGVLVDIFNARNASFGDDVIVQGMLEAPKNFNHFAYDEYLRANNIYSTIRPEKLVINRSGAGFFVYLKVFKKALSDKIESVLSQPHSSLLSGMVFGAKSGMSEDFSEKLRMTGTTHIIAVSGYNITVLISSLVIFAPILGRSRLSLFSIVFIIVFMFFVGIDNIPVVRASLMGISFILGQFLGKKSVTLILLPLTVALLLLHNPLIFKLLSFQLSFLSTLGLILFSDVIERKIQFIPEFLREDVASTFAAILFTLPVTLNNFGEVSLIAPIVNFFVLPIVPVITIYGILLIIGIILIYPIAKIAAWFAWLFLEYMVRIISFFSNFRYAMVETKGSFGNSLGNLLIVLLIILSLEICFRKQRTIQQGI